MSDTRTLWRRMPYDEWEKAQPSDFLYDENKEVIVVPVVVREVPWCKTHDCGELADDDGTRFGYCYGWLWSEERGDDNPCVWGVAFVEVSDE